MEKNKMEKKSEQPQAKFNSENRTLLHLAADEGHLDVVNTLVVKRPKGLVRSAYIDKEDENGKTALQLAVSRGHPDVVSYLLLEHADLGPIDELLRLAVRKTKNNAALVATLLEAIPVNDLAKCINSVDSDGNSAVHLAASKSCIKSVEYLLEAGGKAVLKNLNQETPLMKAVFKGNLDMVMLLVANAKSEGVSRQHYINMKDNANNTALQQAIYEGHPEIVRYLLQERAEQGALGSLLRFSVQSTKPNLKVIEILLKEIPEGKRAGCINAVEETLGYSVMHLASKHADVLFVEQLLNAGGSVSTRSASDANEQTALMLAAYSCNLPVVKLMLDTFDAAKEGISKYEVITMEDKNGQTALDLATRANIRVLAGLNCFVHAATSTALVTYLADESISVMVERWHGNKAGNVDVSSPELSDVSLSK